MLIDSVPPATITSTNPAFTPSTACTTAVRPEPHTRFTVSPGTVWDSPACSAACRATFIPCPACSTQPRITSPTSSPVMPARAMASRTTIAPSCGADRSFNAPPNDPMGVRHADNRTASLMFVNRLELVYSARKATRRSRDWPDCVRLSGPTRSLRALAGRIRTARARRRRSAERRSRPSRHRSSCRSRSPSGAGRARSPR